MKSNNRPTIETMDFQTTKGDTSLRVINDENSLYNVLLIFNHNGNEETLSFHYDEIKNYGEEQGGEIEECIKEFFKFYHETFGYFTMGAYKVSKHIGEKYPKLSELHDPFNGSYIMVVEQDDWKEEPMEVVVERMKEEYKEEFLQFLNEFGVKMIDGVLDLEGNGYYYFEEFQDYDGEGDEYYFGLSSMTEFLESEEGLKEILSLDINKIHYGL